MAVGRGEPQFPAVSAWLDRTYPKNGVVVRVEIARRRQQRADFLKRLYEIVDANVSEFVNAFDIAHELGISDEECARISAYLEEKEYIHIDDHKAGTIRITAAGIDQVETA